MAKPSGQIKELPADFNKWVVFYPAYINAGCNQKEGRKVPAEFAVQQPHVKEISEVCTAFKIPCIIEPKAYPRDALSRFTDGGRCKIRIKDESGKPLQEDIPNRKALYLKIATHIPKLKSRVSSSASGGGSSAGAPSGGGGGNKKKKK